jgi:hypothetical protein
MYRLSLIVYVDVILIVIVALLLHSTAPSVAVYGAPPPKPSNRAGQTPTSEEETLLMPAIILRLSLLNSGWPRMYKLKWPMLTYFGARFLTRVQASHHCGGYLHFARRAGQP